MPMWATKPPPGAQIDWGNPLSKGMVGCWLFNEGAGTVIKNLASPMANGVATITSASWDRGKFGPGFVHVVGGTSWVDCGLSNGITDLATEGLNPALTIVCWAKRGATGTGALIYKSDGDSQRGWWMDISGKSPNNWGLIVTGSTGDLIRASSTLPVIGQWTQLAATFKDSQAVATNARIFLNGIEPAYAVSQAGTSNLTDATINCWLGVAGVGSTNFDGLIDHMLVWRRALQPSEIMRLYAEPFAFLVPPARLLPLSISISSTTTRTQTGIANIRATTTRTQSGVARILGTSPVVRPASFGGMGFAGATIAGAIPTLTPKRQTISGIARISVTSSQAQTAIARIAATASQPQTGVARVTVTTPRMQTAIADVRATTSRNQTGIADIRSTTTRNQTAIADVRATTTRNQTGIADVRVTTTRNQTAIADVRATTSRNQTGIADIRLTTSQTQTGIARITATTTRNQTGIADIRLTTTRNQTGIADIRLTTTRNQTGISDIRSSTAKTQTGIARVTVTSTGLQHGIARITATAAQPQTGIADVRSTTTRNQTAIADVRVTATRNQTAIADIRLTTNRDQTGIADVRSTTARTQTGIADVRLTTTRNQSGIASIVSLQAFPANLAAFATPYFGQGFFGGVPLVAITTVQAQTAIARITATTTRNQTGIASIRATTSRNQTGIAAVRGTTGRDQPGVARITATAARAQTGVSSIVSAQATSAQLAAFATPYFGQGFFGGVPSNNFRSARPQSGIANITATTTRNQVGISDIVSTSSWPQAALSRISATSVKNQSGIARILVAQTTIRSISGTAFIIPPVPRMLDDETLNSTLDDLMFDVDFRTPYLTDVATYPVDGVAGLSEVLLLYRKYPRARIYLNVPLIINQRWQGNNWKQVSESDVAYLRRAFIAKYGNVDRRTTYKLL